MTSAPSATRWSAFALWGSVAVYALARVFQVYADSLAVLLLVLLHVIPPAVVAILHGRIVYGWRGILAFTCFCLGTAALFESFSLRTGFPFGHYFFTNVMGPKLFGLPLLLVLAYLGIGYCAWILALLILGYREIPLRGTQLVAAPLLASFLMLAWDLSMDPQWATVDRAWIWRDGGAFFGVPVSNFFGWFLTAYLFFQAFALYLRLRLPTSPVAPGIWEAPIAIYAVCALGNLLLRPLRETPIVVCDPSGECWRSADIRAVCSMVSLLLMVPMAALAWLRAQPRDAVER